MSTPVTAPPTSSVPDDVSPVVADATDVSSLRHPVRRYLLVTALLLLFGGLIWMVVAFGAHGFKDVDARRADERYKIYGEVYQAENKALTDPPSVLNKEQGKIRVPLQDAINLTLRDINANKPHAAYPIQQTAPAPNPAPPADAAKAPAAPGQVPNTANANNPVLPKQADAAGSNAANGNPSPTPTPAQGTTNPR